MSVESHVCRRQILMSKVDPRAKRVKTNYILAVDPQYRHSKEAGGANQDIYDDFELKKPFGLHDLDKYFKR